MSLNLGKELLLLDDEKVTPQTCGEVNCSIAWALSADGITLVPTDTKKTFSAMGSVSFVSHMETQQFVGKIHN